MRFTRLGLLCLFFLLFSSAQLHAEDEPDLEPSVIYKRASKATVVVETDKALGTGFVVQKGMIITNYHVIQDGASIFIKPIGQNALYPVHHISAQDPSKDLAILYCPDFQAEPLPLANPEEVEIGSQIYVIGNPKGLEGTISNGLISGNRRMFGRNEIQISAPISSGNSGGPVINKKGRVVGIATSTFRGGQNLNFAVPVDDVYTLMFSQRDAADSAACDNARFQTFWIRGSEEFDQGKFAASKESFRGAFRELMKLDRFLEDSRTLQVFRRIADCSLYQDKYTEAESIYTLLLELTKKGYGSGELPFVNFGIAACALADSQPAKALEACNVALLQLGDDNSKLKSKLKHDLLLMKTRGYLMLHQKQNSIDTWSKIVEASATEQNRARDLLLIGTYYSEAGYFEDAISILQDTRDTMLKKSFETGSTATPDSIFLRIVAGCYRRLHRYKNAENAIRSALEADLPTKDVTLIVPDLQEFALLMIETNQLEEARKLITALQSWSAKTRASELRFLLFEARTQLNNGNLVGAQKTIRTALSKETERTREMAALLTIHGEIKTKTNQINEAKKDLDAASELYKNLKLIPDTDLLIGLGEWYSATNQYAKAKTFFDSVERKFLCSPGSMSRKRTKEFLLSYAVVLEHLDSPKAASTLRQYAAELDQ